MKTSLTDQTRQLILINAARTAYAQNTDDIEIDDDAKISYADKGFWIAAWVWLSDDTLQEATK